MRSPFYRRRRKRTPRRWRPLRPPILGPLGLALLGVGAALLGLSLHECAHALFARIGIAEWLGRILVMTLSMGGLGILAPVFCEPLNRDLGAPRPLRTRLMVLVAVVALLCQLGSELEGLLGPIPETAPFELRAFGASLMIGAALVGSGFLGFWYLRPPIPSVMGPHLRADTTRPRRVLILFAPPDKRLRRPVKSKWYVSRIHPEDPTPATELYDTESDIYMEPKPRLRRILERCPRDEPWAGERLLRAIEPHLDADENEEQRLECLYLIGSQGAHGSFRELPNLFDFLRAALPISVDILIASKAVHETSAFSTEMANESAFHPEFAVDTSRPEQCIEFVNDLLGRLREQGFRESEIALDISDMLSPRLGRTIGEWMRGGLALQSAPRWLTGDRARTSEELGPSSYSLSRH